MKVDKGIDEAVEEGSKKAESDHCANCCRSINPCQHKESKAPTCDWIDEPHLKNLEGPIKVARNEQKLWANDIYWMIGRKTLL